MFKEQGQYEDDEMRTQLPYEKLFGTKGALPSSNVEQKLGEHAQNIQRVMVSVENRIFEAMDTISRKPVCMKGVSVRVSMFEEYLQTHCIIHADKDGSSVVMSIRAYLHECTCHMQSSI